MIRFWFNKRGKGQMLCVCSYLGSGVDGEQRNRIHAASGGDVEDGPPLPTFKENKQR